MNKDIHTYKDTSHQMIVAVRKQMTNDGTTWLKVFALQIWQHHVSSAWLKTAYMLGVKISYDP